MLLIPAFCSCLIGLVAAADETSTAFPLDPLSAGEITLAVQVLRAEGKVTESSRFSLIALREPAKAEALNFKPGEPMRREAFAVVYERSLNRTFEAVVDLRKRSPLSWKEIPGVQPIMMNEELSLVTSIVRNDPQWQAAMRKRGITDFESVLIDAWAAGSFGFADEADKRVARGIPYWRGKGKNQYGRPIEGIYAYVDLNAKRIIRIVDTGIVPLTTDNSELDPEAIGRQRVAPKPLQVIQPAGADFEINGHEIRWQNWRFRYALHPREGLVLHTISYEDQGRARPVLYRGSLSEMVVPYGDPGEGWFFRNAFDEGEYGLGPNIFPLEAGTDLPGNATLLNAVMADETGKPVEKPRVIALYERDGGVLWKHVDYVTNSNQSRRARQLVIGCFATIGNYDYGFNWVFHQDGALEVEVLLTGAMSVKGVAAKVEADHTHGNGSAISYGHLVAPNIEAVHHQHFFNFRLDLDVDGSGNSVVEQNTESLSSGPHNPYHNAWVLPTGFLK
jgi:primary-amine oxidase